MQSITLLRANFLTASYASQLQTRRDALAQENQSIVLKGIPMKLGKRGQKFLEYQKTFCWNRREQDLLRIISFEAQVYYQEKDLERIVAYCEKDTLAVAQVLLRFNNEVLLKEEDIVKVA